MVKRADVDNSLDSILIHLGDFGKYQSYVFSLVCVAVVMHSMVHIAYVFTAKNLDYRWESIVFWCEILFEFTRVRFELFSLDKQKLIVFHEVLHAFASVKESYFSKSGQAKKSTKFYYSQNVIQ